jgi:hypothetical protein
MAYHFSPTDDRAQLFHRFLKKKKKNEKRKCHVGTGIQKLLVIHLFHLREGRKWVKGAKFEKTGAKTPHISRT